MLVMRTNPVCVCEGLLFCCRGIKGALETSRHNKVSQSLPSQVVIVAKYRVSFLLSLRAHTHTQKTPDLAGSSHSRCSAASAKHILPPEVCGNLRRSFNMHAERKRKMEEVSGNIAPRRGRIFLLPRREQNKEFPAGGKSCRLLLRCVHVASLALSSPTLLTPSPPPTLSRSVSCLSSVFKVQTINAALSESSGCY